MAASSAKIFIEEQTVDGKSLMYNIKSRGPNIEPCGTPERTRDQAEEHSLITIRCLLLVRNEQNHWSNAPRIP